MKPIGFRSYKEKEQTEQQQNEKKNKTVALLTDYFTTIYKPTGETPEKTFKTTTELLYELRETIPTSSTTITTELDKLGYKTQLIGNIVHWVLYETIEQI